MHPLAKAIAPLLDRIGATAAPANEHQPGDVLLYWGDEPALSVRLPSEDVTAALDRMIDEVERELGSSLPELPRATKQQAVRLLEERGAFTMRKSVESVAKALGVSRFTVYNYLNRAQADSR